MNKLVAITALVTGALVLLIPRYILPACEYAGYPHMHCSDTARAEYVVGALLLLIAGATFFLKKGKPLLAPAIAGILCYVAAFWLPDIIGYCQNPRMPCNYGMVPGVRFIAVAGTIIMVIASFNLLKSAQKKGKP